jgi:hypothetical protein
VVSQPDFAVKRVMIPHLNPDDNTMDANVSLTTSQLLDTLICLALAIDAMIVVMGENDEEVILPMLDYKWARDPVDSILRARLAGSHEWCKESFPDGVGRSILDGWINCRVNLWVTPVKEPKVRDTPDLLGHIAGGDAG